MITFKDNIDFSLKDRTGEIRMNRAATGSRGRFY